MSLQPRNVFYENLARIEQRQKTLDEHLGGLKDALPDNRGVEAALKQLGAVLTKAGEAQAENSKRQAEALSCVAAATEYAGKVLATQLQPASDAPTVFLYLAVDADGTFDERSQLGKFLVEVCGDSRGLALLCHGKGRRADHIDRDRFVARARDVAASIPGFGDIWGDYDFGRFHDLAPHVLRLVEAARPAPTPGQPPPDKATAQ